MVCVSICVSFSFFLQCLTVFRVLDFGFTCCCLVTKSCMTLWDPSGSLSGSSVHGISQARILEWITISFSRGSSQSRVRTCVSCIAGGFFTTELPGKPFAALDRFILRYFIVFDAVVNGIVSCLQMT